VELKVVNIGDGLLVPAECLVLATRKLQTHFRNCEIDLDSGRKRSKTVDVCKQQKQPERSRSAAGRISDEQTIVHTRTEKADEFHTAIDLLIRGTYPGPLVHAILDWSAFKNPTAQFRRPYNRFRIEKILRMYV
jgi:hypothetical protein